MLKWRALKNIIFLQSLVVWDTGLITCVIIIRHKQWSRGCYCVTSVHVVQETLCLLPPQVVHCFLDLELFVSQEKICELKQLISKCNVKLSLQAFSLIYRTSTMQHLHTNIYNDFMYIYAYTYIRNIKHLYKSWTLHL